jgi:predicted methyltransferase
VGASANEKVCPFSLSPAANIAEIRPSDSDDPQVSSSLTNATTTTLETAEIRNPNQEPTTATIHSGGGGPSKSVPRDTSGPSTNITQHVTRGQEAAARVNREMLRPGGIACSEHAMLPGTETLSQEELDEMDDDPDADMEQ